MPEGGLTSASSLRYLPDKTAGRNNLNEEESNAVLDDSGLDLEEPVSGGTILLILSVNPEWIRVRVDGRIRYEYAVVI